MPQVSQTPRHGVYEERVLGGEQVVVSGNYRGGLRQGTWTYAYPSGQVRLVQNWDRGLKQGREQSWAENGQLVGDGCYTLGRQVGEWTFWYESGELKARDSYDGQGREHGPYQRYYADGQLQVTGESVEGKAHGRWIEYYPDGQVKEERGYFRGMDHGTRVEYHPDGTLAFRGGCHCGRLHGMQERYDSEGQLIIQGEEVFGHPVGEHLRNGERETFVRGLPQKLVADDRKRDRVLADLAATRDHFKWRKYIENTAKSDYDAYLVHLWRAGFQLGDERYMWRDFVRGAGLLSGQDVVTFLRQVETEPNDLNIMPHWYAELDDLLLSVYNRDPEPIDEAFDSLPEPIRKGIAYVRGRLGQDIGTILYDELPWVVRRYLTEHELSVQWPFLEGSVHVSRNVVNADRTPGPVHDEFAALFGTPEQWRTETARVALELASEGHLDIAAVRVVVENATPEELVKLLNGAYHVRGAALVIYKSLVEWRADDAATLTRIALEHVASAPHEGGWPVVAAAITRHRAEGTEPPQELVDALQLVSEGSATSGDDWYRLPLRDLDFKQAHDVSFRAAHVGLPIGAAAPGQAPLRAAMQALAPAQARSVLERTMASRYGWRAAAQYLYTVDDPDIWSRFLDRMAAEKVAYDELLYGLGEIGVRAIPLLLEQSERPGTKQDWQVERLGLKRDWREYFGRAILIALCRTIVDDGDFPEELDRLFTFGEGMDHDEWDGYAVFAQRVLWLLPADRVEGILLSGLASESRAVFARAFASIGFAPTPAVLELAMSGLLRREKDLDSTQVGQVATGLRALGDYAGWVRWIRRSGGGANLAAAFANELGKEAYEILDEEVRAEGVSAVTEMDDIERLRVLAERLGGSERIYVLRKDVPDSGTYNVIGGAAPGVDASRWPRGEDDAPMTHLFTLDTSTMPELKREVGADVRTVSVFCSDTEYNEALYPGNDDTAVVCSTEDQVAGAGDPPGDAEIDEREYFEPVACDVDPAVWDDSVSDPELQELKDMIYRAHARVLGKEMFIQGDEPEDGFLMQFDGDFYWMNLGDCGIMYVYKDTAYFEGH